MFFIVSTGRAGSRGIAHLLSAVHGCTCLHEPNPPLIFESSRYRYGEIPASELARILRQTRPPSIGNERYCESNQTLSLIIPVLAEVFPQAKFVWLVRNGLDMVASGYSKQWYSGHSENHDRYEDCTPLEKAWIDGRIRGDRCGDVPPQTWQGMDRFAKVCWYWSYVNRLIARDLETYAPGRFMMVRLETLSEQLPDLLQWMGLRAAILPQPKKINRSKRPPYPWREWAAAHRQAFIQWCAEEMDALYPQWRDDQGIWRGVPYVSPQRSIPAWLNRYRLLKALNRLLAPNPLR